MARKSLKALEFRSSCLLNRSSNMVSALAEEEDEEEDDDDENAEEEECDAAVDEKIGKSLA